MQPLVSIIIPTYNRAHLIGETLDSVLAQTYTRWECIVVDDGSTDTTDSVMADYVSKDSRFQYHHRPKNRPKGANACRNYGFEVSKGEYINWFDSDDLMVGEKLKTQINLLEGKGKSYCICQTEMFDFFFKNSQGLRSNSIASANRLNDYIRFEIFWLTGAPLWKKKFIEYNHLSFDESLKQSQDYDFHVSALFCSDSYSFTNEVLVKARMHDDQLSTSIIDTWEKFRSNVKVRYKVFNLYFDEIDNKTKIYLFQNLFHYYITSIQAFKWKNAFRIYVYLMISFSKLNFQTHTKLIALTKWFIASMTTSQYFRNPISFKNYV